MFRKRDNYFYRGRMDSGTKALLYGVGGILLFAGVYVLHLNHEQKLELAHEYKNAIPATFIPTTTAQAEEKMPVRLTTKTSSRERATVEIPTESIDERGIKHRTIERNETLCRISKKEYGTTAFAIDLAWFNGFDDPGHILKDGKILLPPSEKFLSAPFGWPEVPATSEQIASRSILEGEDLVATSQPADGAAPESAESDRLVAQSRTSCTTKHHIVVEGEFTVWDVAQDEYQLDLYGLGLALGAANRLEGRNRLSLGQELRIPCIGREVLLANPLFI